MEEAKKFTNMNMDEEQLEEWAFYESGLVAHGCLENIDEYMREAITRYGRLLLSKQKKEIIDLQAELEYYRGVAEHLGAGKAVSQRDKMLEEFHQIEQILGEALGYPMYKDDGVCVAPNTAASLAMEAAHRIRDLEDELMDYINLN